MEDRRYFSEGGLEMVTKGCNFCYHLIENIDSLYCAAYRDEISLDQLIHSQTCEKYHDLSRHEAPDFSPGRNAVILYHRYLFKHLHLISIQ
jgi:hypothetical protein